MPNYEQMFLEISNGFSECDDILLKHSDTCDSAELHSFKERLTADYEKNGFHSEKEMLDILNKRGAWTEEQEKKFHLKKRELEGLQKSLAKIASQREKRTLEAHISNIKKDFESQKENRLELLGRTTEVSINYMYWDMKVCLSLYNKDKKRLLTWEEYDCLPTQEFVLYNNLFFDHYNLFNDKNIRNIAIQGFFYDIFRLIPDSSPYLLFNKPLHLLTNWQILLAKTAKRVAYIIDNVRGIPEAAYSDVDALFEYAESNNKTNAAKESKEESQGLKRKAAGKSFAKNPEAFS